MGRSLFRSGGALETRTRNGYKQFRDPLSGLWVYVHRRVLEKVLGGPLRRGYEVHHKNQDKLDNRPENLVLVSRDDHDAIHEIDREMRTVERELGACRDRRKAHVLRRELYDLEKERRSLERRSRRR